MDKKHQGSAEETFTMMECGNLDMNFPIKYGILLLGNTKAGKTTSAHYLTNQTLKGSSNNANSIVYHVQDGSEQFKNAKIGDNESISETQIPNFFTFKEGQETIYLIDCPGYLDSYGCYRIISNRFFHYQVFSKVENVKFIITFHYNDMNKTADMLKKTFKEFISGFDNISDIKEQIFNATSIMVTGVPRNLHEKFSKEQLEEWKKSGKEALVEIVREKFQTSPTNIGENEKFMVDLKECILSSNRLFIFEEAIKDQICKKDNKILKSIGTLSKFWCREKVSINVPKLSGFEPSTKEDIDEKETKKQIEMDHINISIASYITENTKDFDSELKCLKEYYEKSVLNQFEGLKQVIESILEDIEAKEEVTKEEPKSYLIEKIRQLSKNNEEKNPICVELNKSYDKKRKEVKEKLFETFDLFDKDGSKKSTPSSSRNKASTTSTEIPFWVCEIKTMQNIEQISALSTDSELLTEGNDKLDYLSFILKKLLDLIYNLCTLKKLKDEKEDKAKNAVALDYVYKIYKNVDISNKLNKLIKKSTAKSEKTPTDDKDKNDNVTKLNSGMFFILIDYPSKLNKVFNRSKELLQVLIINLSKIDTLKLTSNAAEVVSKFFSSYLKRLERQGDEPREFEYSFEEIKKILEAKIVGLRSKSFEAKNLSKIATLKEMEEYRLEVMVKINENIHAMPLILEHNRILQLIAQKLDDNGQYKTAIEIYEALQDARSCMQTLEKKLKKAKEGKYEEFFSILMEYAKKANNFYMKEQAREKSYEALSLAQKHADEERLSEAKEFIYENLVKPASTENKVPPFKLFLTEENSPAFISEQLSAEIISKSKK